MNSWQNIIEEGKQTFDLIADRFTESLPYVVSGIVVIILGWLIAKGVSYLLHKILILFNVNRLSKREKIQSIMDDANIQLEISDMVSKFTYWIIFLFFIVLACRIFGWESVFNELLVLIGYMPKFISGVVIFIVGLILSNFLKNFIHKVLAAVGVKDARTIGRFTFLIMLVVVGMASLNYMGVDTRFFSTNILMVVGAMLLAFSIAFAISSRSVMKNILAASYNKKNLAVGQKVIIGKIFKTKGTIISIGNTSVTIKTAKGSVVIPAKTLMEEIIEIEEE